MGSYGGGNTVFAPLQASRVICSMWSYAVSTEKWVGAVEVRGALLCMAAKAFCLVCSLGMFLRAQVASGDDVAVGRLVAKFPVVSALVHARFLQSALCFHLITEHE